MSTRRDHWKRWVARAAKSFPDVLRLARTDRNVLTDWARHVAAVEQSLGETEAKAYTAMVLAAVERPEIAWRLARALPDLLAGLSPAERARFHRLMMGVIRDAPDVALKVARAAPGLLEQLDDVALADFVAKALQVHAESPRKAESFLRMESGAGRDAAETLRAGTALSAVHRMLTLYARAHCGESVHIRPGSGNAFSDGRHLYLPERIAVFGDERDALVYQVLTARAAGVIEFGTLDLDLDAVDGDWPAPSVDVAPIDRMCAGFAYPSLARDLFVLIEEARVESMVRQTYPGMARKMDDLGQAWRPPLPSEPGDRPLAQALHLMAVRITGRTPPQGLLNEAMQAADAAWAAVMEAPRITVADSVAALQRAMPHLEDLIPAPPDGGPEWPESSEAVGSAGLGALFDPDRLGEADRALEATAASLLRSLSDAGEEDPWALAREAAAEGSSFAEMAEFLDRMEPPPGPTQNDAPDGPSGARSGRLAEDPDVAQDTASQHFRYPEWDYRLDDHKPDWVGLVEYRLSDGDSGFVSDVWDEHGPLIRRVRRSFESIRPEEMKLHRRTTDGDELDLDAVVSARIERRAGGVPPEGLYQRRVRARRDVAVAFLVDMSSSTNELLVRGDKRIIDVEREALVVAAEAVHALGDTAAIYGYSGYGRDQVAFYVAKEFDEPFDDAVRARIGRLNWKMENRDGAAIRHATAKLAQWPARVKLLILLSDGKPLDCGCDTYADTYAQADTRMALMEARRAQIHPFCITVDPHGREYLRWMYGDGGYTVIDHIAALPERLPAVYRRLTR